MKTFPPGVDHLPFRDVEVGTVCHTHHFFMGVRSIMVVAEVLEKSPPKGCADDWAVTLRIKNRSYMVPDHQMVLGGQMAHRHLAAVIRWLNATKEERGRMLSDAVQRNKNGLSFSEWHTAAGQVGSSENLIKAWENGEDPAEYRTDTPMAVAMLPALTDEERAALVGLVVTRTKLQEVRAQMAVKRDELQELESQRCALVSELDTHRRKFAESFNPFNDSRGDD